MAMWKVTVAPIENYAAWPTFIDEGVIGIGWPDRLYDDNANVRRFHKIAVGDWIVAHVPASHGGMPCLARGIGKVIGGYREVSPGAGWRGRFRRQHSVKWHKICDLSLKGILNSGQFRMTVVELLPEQELQILKQYSVT